jgi:hypothetical protein
VIVLFLGVAFGLEPPARPLPAPVVEGECSRARSVGPGDSVPCAGLLIGLSDSADLLATEVWAQQIADLYRITTTEQQHEIDLCAWQVEHLEAELVAASAPVPFLERPSTVLGVGVVAGVIIVLGSGYALQMVQD